MDNKINIQIIDILLNDNRDFTNKYYSISNNYYNYDNLLTDYFKNKNMNSIMIDNNNQSICFTNQKYPVSIYNRQNKKTDEYYEEIHLHSNNLDEFDEFVDYLHNSEYSSKIQEMNKLPHSESLTIEKFKDYELVLSPMTNEVTNTKSLMKIFNNYSNESIFRAVAIHFAELLDNYNQIDIDLVRKLNNIYKSETLDKGDCIFSNNIFNRLINLSNTLNEEHKSNSIQSNLNSYNIDSDEYTISIKEDGLNY